MVVAAGLSVPASATQQERGPKPVLPERQAVMNDPEFQWQPVPGATAYRLEVSLDHTFTNIAHTVDTAATRYVDTTTWPAAGYWWRVKVIAPFDGPYSNVRSFTRRWIGPDAGGGGQEIARPDNVTVEDFAQDPGIQVPGNALKISWEPVAGASYYEVQFDGDSDKVCTTPHTVFTPYLSGSLASDDAGDGCDPELGSGTHWVRVRAVDETVTEDTKIFSLWSDEARSLDASVPAPVIFSLGANLTGPGDAQPAVLTKPRNATVFLDVPTFEWQPVSWASEYELVLALDQDFTNVVGKFRTTNTRLVPLQRLPENTAVRSYYWYVVPCIADGSAVKCLNENRAVNREGKFRSFKKQSVLVRLSGTSRRGTPWVEFTWEPFATTMSRFARRTGTQEASLGGIKWYEVQIKNKGTRWDTARTMITDLPGLLPTDLGFGGRFDWRVRPVDESGTGRPWSESLSLRTPRAVPDNPVALKAFRTTKRVTLLWRAPKVAFFPVTGYSVYYSNSGTRWKPLTQVPRTRAAFKVGKSQRYWFMVTANNYAGEGPPSRVYVPR